MQGPAGELINFTKIGYTTGNSYTMAYVSIPPQAGPAPHIHHWTNEWFYFPEGGIEMFTSDQMYPNASQIPNGEQLPKAAMHRYYTKPGDLIYGPAFYVHGFRNEGNVSRPLINIWTPDKISQWFFAVGQLVTAPYNLPPVSETNKNLFVSEAPKYGINMSSSWDEYVANWTDDWNPPLGMEAHGQELLDLLSQNGTVPFVTCRAALLDNALFQSSFVLIYLVTFMIARILSIHS
jgi:mannose-6-phosphate isomerase-like protein (cupin superfamily)